jgi:flavin reductase
MTDNTEFFEALRLFASGVTVVTAGDGVDVHGMTANAVAALSAAPVQMIVCVAKQAKTAQLLREGARFTINVLREEQEAISNHFAGSWKEPQPPNFRFVSWEAGQRLEGCLAAIGCKVERLIEGGDHWIVIGSVLAIHQGIEPRRPLVYYNRRYHHLRDKPSGVAPERQDFNPGEPQVFYDPW